MRSCYQAPRRARAAADTRATILATAMRLFLERGYGGVTVSDIAREASIAVPTVYASTGGKSAILAALSGHGTTPKPGSASKPRPRCSTRSGGELVPTGPGFSEPSGG